MNPNTASGRSNAGWKNVYPFAEGASAMRDYAKKRVKELGLAGEGKVRINQAGSLDRCGEGPSIVVYPDAVWYTYVDKSDIDEIIEEHLQNGRVVERLRM